MMNAICTEYYDFMVEMGIATENELGLAMGLCGVNEDTFKSVLFIRTGYRDLEQIKEEMEDE